MNKTMMSRRQEFIDRVSFRIGKTIAARAQKEVDQVTVVEVFGMTADEVGEKIKEYDRMSIVLDELARTFRESIPDLRELRATLQAGEGHALESLDSLRDEIKDLDNLRTLVANINNVFPDDE